MDGIGSKSRSVADLSALKQQVEQLEGKAPAVTPPAGEAPLAPLSKRKRAVPADQGIPPRVAAASPSALEAALEKAKPQIVAAFRGLIDDLEGTPRLADLDKASLGSVAKSADDIYRKLRRVDDVWRMLRALAPSLQKAFPTDQLELVQGALKTELDRLEAQERQLKQGATSGASGFAAATPAPQLPPVLTLTAVGTMESAAAKLGEILGDPALAQAMLKAGPGGDAHLKAVQGAALLADYVAGTLDYGHIRNSGWSLKDQSVHQKRAYSAGDRASSAPRQAEGKKALQTALQAALSGPEPTQAVERAVVERFLLELGLPTGASQGWQPSFGAVAAALNDELFAPLRAINQGLVGSMKEGFGSYRDRDFEKATQIAVEMTRAVSEGRFEAWRRALPENVVQLQSLSDPQRASFLESLKLQAEVGGRKLASREGAGAELFWATKTGGPSHGFDVMTRCVMALLTNLRTKVIQVEDAAFPRVAGRAYLKAIDSPEGRPFLVLEGVQFDFSYGAGQREVVAQILDHAQAKAKTTGLELLLLSGIYQEALKRGGTPSAFVARPARIHPVVLLEASDYMGPGHDGPIPQPVDTMLKGDLIAP